MLNRHASHRQPIMHHRYQRFPTIANILWVLVRVHHGLNASAILHHLKVIIDKENVVGRSNAGIFFHYSVIHSAIYIAAALILSHQNKIMKSRIFVDIDNCRL